MMKILLATDGSKEIQAAINSLLRFPIPKDNEITLISVIEKEVYKSIQKTELSDEQQTLLEQTKEMLHNEAEEVLNMGKAQLKETGWSVTTLIRSGHPASEIVRATKELSVDLVVMGSHGLTGVKRFLLGSTTDQVLAYAPCSVLIIKTKTMKVPGESEPQPTQEENDKFFRILLAYDQSAPARKAAEFCASLPLDEMVEVTALTVLPLVTRYRQDIKQRLSWIWKEKKKIAEKALEEIRTDVEWPTPNITTVLHESPDVSQEILDISEEYNSDLIVLGYKGKGAIEKFLLGSVTHRIAHHASCSVLAIRNDNKNTDTTA